MLILEEYIPPGKLIVGHKLYRQKIPIEESLGNELLQIPPPGDPLGNLLGWPEMSGYVMGE